ncbi:3 -5 exoribonuclease 1 [Labeo rohita]|uniref:3-5 exoribonuclease 1 n=1 Tax=Labeo rohita TaxID=84645 RepID=A0A498MY49_LABRO|nr:3 -5 exoribonuclease 1 [Labeo rohita]
MESQKKTSQPENKTSKSEEDEEEQCCGNTSCEKSEKQEPSSPKQGDFSDPVYKEIAVANGAINRMNRDELRAKCAELKLDTRGVKDVLRKRLKSYYKRQKLMLSSAANGNSDVYFDYICVVDFEATCEENNPPDYLHEIIEFPMVLIDTHTLEIVPRTQTKLICMLENLGMQYDGRPHCGLDDSRNIARIAIHMLEDGCQLRVNECLHSGEPRSVPISAPIEGAPAPQTPKKRN